MPSVLSREYPILVMFAQNWAVAKVRIETGVATPRDHETADIAARPFNLRGLDPRDFGFGDLTEFDAETALSDERAQN